MNRTSGPLARGARGLIALLPLVVAACAPAAVPTDTARFHTVAASAEHDVRFAPGRARLEPGERSRLIGFLDARQPSPEARVTVAGGRDPRQRRTVADLVRAVYGLPVDLAPAAGSGERVTVSLRDRRVEAEACGAATMETPAHILPPGCANAANLAAMVERASDLQRGRVLGPALAGPVGVAADRYLNGQVATLPDQLEDR
ncbi:CpaD family pilus assembly lipoprotein [Marinivivus vitaminiproducens]|uniref:CpaD family pilus assembly lipoprotein n=1 Tax=Marinivivus vitaminiproducens TaxID=3035935 RepID=UPI0027A6D5C3|nr:CpaD family pilus assembly lipoprotein [Geminicoccaceae bacterium SCSIO 64248]